MKCASIARFIFVSVLLLAIALTFVVIIYYFIQQNQRAMGVKKRIETTISFANTHFNSTTNPPNGFNINLIMNGGAEDGPCEMNTDVTHPTAWDYDGQITQMGYNSTDFGSMKYESPGPLDRGRCYFAGLRDQMTSMWQNIELTSFLDSGIFKNGLAKFRLSAWLGGWEIQNDNARVILTFFDEMGGIVTDRITLGPVTASDRNGITSMLYREINGLVPIEAYSVLVRTVLTRVSENDNDASVDNIVLVIYQ